VITSHKEKMIVAELLWQSYCGKATVAKPCKQTYKKVVSVNEKF